MTTVTPESPFETAVHSVLLQWTALKECFMNEFGGPETKEETRAMHDDLMLWARSWKAGKEPPPQELEEYFVEFFECFEVLLEDGSPRQVASLVTSLFAEKVAGRDTLAKRVITQTPETDWLAVVAEEEEEEEAPPLVAAAEPAAAPQVDADGWHTMPSKGKKKKGKNKTSSAAAVMDES